MKKICIVLMVVMVLSVFPLAAFAQTDTPESTPSPTPTEPKLENVENTYFNIDNENTYQDMDKPYKDGYMPIAKNGKAVVIMPLTTNSKIADNSIKVTPNLGDTSSSPFVFKNYQKTVVLQNNKVNNSEQTVPSYYVRFDLDLTAQRINGTYPLAIEIQAIDGNGNLVLQNFTVYITITDGIDPNAKPGEPENPETVKKPTSQPIIIVSGHSVSPSPIQAGEEFTVDISLLNTNESKSVQNMTVNVSSDQPGLTLLNKSNTFYFKKLAKGKVLNLELKYKTGLDVPAGKYNINLAISYDNSEAATLSSSGIIPIEIAQPLRVELAMPQIAESVNAGDTLPLSFQVMNLGRSGIFNVRCEIAGAGLIPTGTAFIGNMEAGTSASADVNVFIGSKDMSEKYDGSDKYGLTNGKVTLIYEDANGKEYTQEFDFTTTINEPIISASTDEPIEEDKASQWWISLIVVGIIGVGVGAWIIIRKKKAKNA